LKQAGKLSNCRKSKRERTPVQSGCGFPVEPGGPAVHGHPTQQTGAFRFRRDVWRAGGTWRL